MPEPTFGNPKSAWWFYGTLRPITATRFHVQQVNVRDRVWLEVFHDSIAMWSTPCQKPVAGREEAREMFGLVLGAYALLTKVSLDWSLDGWIEAKDATLSGSVLGIIVDRRGHDPKVPTRSKRSVAMRRAARLAVQVQPIPGFRLALHDMYSAYKEPGDDAFVFAHRAIEDVARGVSGLHGYFRDQDWQGLHTRLGTSEKSFNARKDELEAARHAVAHPKPGDPALTKARASRDQTLHIGRQIVAEALASEPGVSFERRWLEDSVLC